jgi:hypothetical protein
MNGERDKQMIEKSLAGSLPALCEKGKNTVQCKKNPNQAL